MLPRNANTFANNPLDRASHRRGDPEWLAAARRDPQSRILPFFKGQPFIAPGGKDPIWLKPGLLPLDRSDQTLIFLGLDQKKRALFAVELDSRRDPEEDGPLAGLGSFEDLRALASRDDGPPEGELAILAQARAMFEWHRAHNFCARCGAESEIAEAGYKRVCLSCSAEHFPRTDPVVIMAPVCGDQVFLGRQKIWPPGLFSALAGFVEPGETIEDAVRRESWEEAKLTIGAVHYHSTQPWPWPSSLMIGCMAEAADLAFTPDGIELETGRWFTREEIADLLNTPPGGDFWLPPPMAIAHHLIKAFANGWRPPDPQPPE